MSSTEDRCDCGHTRGQHKVVNGNTVCTLCACPHFHKAS